jgi:glucokinase
MNIKLKSLALGIDVGGSKILTAVVDSRGNVFSRDYRPTPHEDTEAVLQQILRSSESAIKQAVITVEELDAIGVGAPGISNPRTGVVFSSPNIPCWHNVPLRDTIAAEIGKTAFLINDANAAALGELYFGAGKGASNLIYVTISTGIGGGIIINGELYYGSIGTAGEVGHMTIDVNGPRCNCGNTGCWEMFASGTALANEAKRRIRNGAATSILDYAGGVLEKVTARTIQTAVEHGDALAKELINQTGYYIGVGLANLLNIFNPEMIIIGGGLSNMGSMLFDTAFRVAGERAFKENVQAVRFAMAELGESSGIIGAATYALNEIRKKG